MRSVTVNVVESRRGFRWLLGMPNLLSCEDGVPFGGLFFYDEQCTMLIVAAVLLVETMHSADEQ